MLFLCHSDIEGYLDTIMTCRIIVSLLIFLGSFQPSIAQASDVSLFDPTLNQSHGSCRLQAQPGHLHRAAFGSQSRCEISANVRQSGTSSISSTRKEAT